MDLSQYTVIAVYSHFLGDISEEFLGTLDEKFKSIPSDDNNPFIFDSPGYRHSCKIKFINNDTHKPIIIVDNVNIEDIQSKTLREIINIYGIESKL